MRTRAYPGDWRAYCEVCGFTRKYRASQMQQRWDKKMVCPDDWEERQPLDFVKTQVEDFSVPWSNATSLQAQHLNYDNQPSFACSPIAVIGIAVVGCIKVGTVDHGGIVNVQTEGGWTQPATGFPNPQTVTLVTKA